MLHSPKHHRRGTTYLVVMGTAMVVSLLGLSALMLQRIQRRGLSDMSDLQQARLNALAALRVGMLRVEADPDWRYNLPHGAWASDVDLGDANYNGGTYTLEGTDPSDGDLTDAPEEPLALTGVGRKGAAVQKVQVTLAPANRGLSCLEVALSAGRDIDLENVAARCDQTLAANDDVRSQESTTVDADVEAVDSIVGGGYQGSTTTGVAPRQMPDTGEVFDYYLAHGQPITIGSLPNYTPNLVQNAGFEQGVDPWVNSWEKELDCELSRDTTSPHGGAHCLKVTNRSGWNDGPCQYLTDFVHEGRNYRILCWVRLASGSQEFRVVLNVKGDSGGHKWQIGPWTTVGTAWRAVGASLPSGSVDGDLQRAMLKVETKSGDPPADFYLDDVAVHEYGPERYLYRAVLSDSLNPYGPANPEGIYVIDCGGADIIIEQCRIVATLVLKNPGGGSLLRAGPTNWRPPRPNFPALLVDGDFAIQMTDAGLNEAANEKNFNPPGAPHPTLGADGDSRDTFPSQIEGLVYVSDDLQLGGHPVIRGAVVAGDNLTASGGAFALFYDAAFSRNPPPGFSGPEQIRVLLDSMKRIVD